MAAGSATALANWRHGNPGEFEDGHQNQQHEDDQSRVAGDCELHQRKQCEQAHAADRIGEGRTGSQRRHVHDDSRETEHGFRKRVQDVQQRRTPGFRNCGERGAEEQCEDRHLQYLVLGDGLRDVLRKDIHENILPTGLMCNGRGGLNDSRQRDAYSSLRDVDSDRAEQQTHGRNDLEEHNRLERDAAHAAQLSVTCDAGHDAAEDKRRDNHADQAEEYLAEEVRLRREAGSVNAQLDACQHGKKGPQQEAIGDAGRWGQRIRVQPSEVTTRYFEWGVKERGEQTCREQHDGRCGDDSQGCACETRCAGYRIRWMSMGLVDSRIPLSYGHAQDCFP